MKKLSSFLAKIALLSFFLTAAAPIVAVSDAFAQSGLTASVTGSNINPDVDNNALTNVMCNALKVVTGNAGKAFAAFAIISIGIGFFTGKVSWGLMIGVAAGIAAMFGAPSIVAAITGESTFDCGN